MSSKDEITHVGTSVGTRGQDQATPLGLNTPSKKEIIKREVISFSVIIFLVCLFRSLLFEPFKIPSGSMIPSLMIGDFILVNKFAYGFKVPFVEWWNDPIYLTGPSDPKRGDVIVFKYPKDQSIYFIKRVIAIPGDTVEVRDKVVFVNGEMVEHVDVLEAESKKIMDDMDDKFKSNQFRFYKSTMGDNKFTYQVATDYDSELSYFPKTTIPKGQFFVMGDNRDFSEDSRRWGFVEHRFIKGRAILVWFSLITPWNEYSYATKFRPWRIGTMIN